MSPRAESTSWLQKQTKNVGAQTELAVDEETASSVDVEAWLQRRGVKYAPATGIPLVAIDTKRSRQNQARKDPIVAESVERFATSMRAGRVFPPIVVYPMGGKVVIIDGNNRHEAAIKAKHTFIQGIIVDEDTPSDVIQLLTVEANNSHGVTPPLDWRLQQAFHLTNLGWEDEDAAEASGVTLTQLRNARAAREATARARAAGVRGFENIPMTGRQYLNGVKLEAVFKAAAQVVASQQYTIEDIRQLCATLRSSTSEAEQLLLLAERASLLDAEKALNREAKKRTLSPKNAVTSGFGLIMKVNPDEIASQIKTVRDRDDMNKKLNETMDQLLRIQIAMETLNEMDAD